MSKCKERKHMCFWPENFGDHPRVISAVVNNTVNEGLRELAQEMRTKPTTAEKALWQKLRRNALGVKFRRQHIIDRYIVDFYCASLGLIVEVDGRIHEYKGQHDQLRDKSLCASGCTVLRFSNCDVEQNIQKVVYTIEETVRLLSAILQR